jgi:histidinol-phosphatase
MADDYRQELEFARRLARVAEAEILPRFRACSVRRKADGTEVTDADRAAEEAMREQIARECPSHGVLGEEFGEDAPQGTRWRWVLDPIDGTALFTLGLPVFGTLVALVEGAEPVVGVIHLPALGETVFARRGGGAWFELRGEEPRPARVAPADRLAEAAVSAGGVLGSDLAGAPGETAFRLSRVVPAAGKFRFVGDCVQHALVCRGLLQAAIDCRMNAWDVAALVPCVTEAGGVASDLHGARGNALGWRSMLSSSSAPLHDALLRELSGS